MRLGYVSLVSGTSANWAQVVHNLFHKNSTVLYLFYWCLYWLKEHPYDVVTETDAQGQDHGEHRDQTPREVTEVRRGVLPIAITCEVPADSLVEFLCKSQTPLLQVELFKTKELELDSVQVLKISEDCFYCTLSW